VCIYSTALEHTTTSWGREGWGDINRCPLEKEYEKGTEKHKNVKEEKKWQVKGKIELKIHEVSNGRGEKYYFWGSRGGGV
jgi:hypothetical protein